MKITIEVSDVQEARIAMEMLKRFIAQNSASDPAQAEPISTLGLTIRTENILTWAGISTLADLVCKSENDLLKLPNFGRKCLKDVGEQLNIRGLSLRSV